MRFTGIIIKFMAVVRNNLITQGLSGTLGRTLVFRRVGGKTVVSTVPSPSSKAPSVAQQNQRHKFQQAILYAKSQMNDPAIKADYESMVKDDGSSSAYNIAVADFFNAPDITEVDLSGYSGRISDKIRVRVTDDFKVQSVGVEIRDAAGTLVEKGNAVAEANKLYWVFTATVANASLSGDKITVKASDLPGNETTDVHTL